MGSPIGMGAARTLEFGYGWRSATRGRRRLPVASRSARPVARRSQMRVERICASFRRTSRGRVSPPGLVTTCDGDEVDSSGGTNASSDTAPFSCLCPPTSPALCYLRDTLGALLAP